MAALLLTVVPPARGLDVFKFDPAVNLRFSAGTYADARMTENPTFLLAGHDLSGLGWGPGDFGVTLISPRHFLTAAHVAPLPGSIVSFVNRDGLVKHYAVESVHAIEQSAGVATDLVLGRLDAPIPPEDRVGFFPTLRQPTSAAFVGLRVYSFGAYQSCGTNAIARWSVEDMLPFARGDNIVDNVIFVTDWFHVTGMAQAQGRDSGSPTFVLHGGRLAIIGTHSSVNISREPYQTADVMIPAYFTQINARLALDGYTFGDAAAIPGKVTTNPH